MSLPPPSAIQTPDRLPGGGGAVVTPIGQVLLSPGLLINPSILPNTGKPGWNSRVCGQYTRQ